LGLFLDFSTFSSLSLLSQGGAERKEGRMADDERWREPIEMTDADREAIRRFAGVRQSPPWESADTTGDAPVKPGASIHDLAPTRRTIGARRDETVGVEVARLVGLGYTMDEVARIFGIRKGPRWEAFMRQCTPNDAIYPMSYPPGSVLYLGSKENPDGRKTTAFLVKEGGWSDEERQEAVGQFKEGELFSKSN
jgi:hypothetical protein